MFTKWNSSDKTFQFFQHGSKEMLAASSVAWLRQPESFPSDCIESTENKIQTSCHQMWRTLVQTRDASRLFLFILSHDHQCRQQNGANVLFWRNFCLYSDTIRRQTAARSTLLSQLRQRIFLLRSTGCGLLLLSIIIITETEIAGDRCRWWWRNGEPTWSTDGISDGLCRSNATVSRDRNSTWLCLSNRRVIRQLATWRSSNLNELN